MKQVKILINRIDKVKDFINTVSKFDNDFDIVSGKYDIDAKSIMGVFGLDLSRPHNLRIYENDESNIKTILDALQRFLVE